MMIASILILIAAAVIGFSGILKRNPKARVYFKHDFKDDNLHPVPEKPEPEKLQ